ncbi:lipoyl(octanoyl) transferase LipB [Leptothrix ochracea]|uniref:lipoyl(octanoyl) transferase LipB n=1 Tax=Leptothrix ochracea TaxID=735331 RepID=UPI0034E2B841
MSSSIPAIDLRVLGHTPIEACIEAMRRFTETRQPGTPDTPGTPDQIWLCEHDPVYTQGVAGKPEHVLINPGIPMLQTNRGGQVTYHGPGQVVAYPLIDLKRLGIYVKEYVFRLEQAAIQVLDSYGLAGQRVRGAPGIYVRIQDARDPTDPLSGMGKIAALGVKVSNHCTYHGLALNVAMDLAPYQGINPCGYAGLPTLDLASLGVNTTWDEAAQRLGQRLSALLRP